MSLFSQFKNSKVTLVKQEGQEYSDIPANVQTKKIFIDDVKIPIEEGDMIIRPLSNGLEEHYLVIDRGYYDKIGGISAHYQVSVEKQTNSKKIANENTSITYNFNAPSNKINIQSTDNSINNSILNSTEKANFQDLRNVIKNIDNSNLLLKLIDDMETNVGKPGFLEKYNNFIQSAANHMTLISSFIPFLSSLLSK